MRCIKRFLSRQRTLRSIGLCRSKLLQIELKTQIKEIIMNLPEPQTRTFTTLISEIEKGQIKIPQFQRDFVWTLQKSAGLIDSIIKGYPIGTLIFWKTKERLRSIRNIGNHSLPEPENGESIDYVLDGQQRLTSLYACLTGLSIQREDSKQCDDIFKNIY